VVSFTLLPRYSRGNSSRYPLDKRLDGPQSRSGRYGEVKVLDTIGTRTPTARSSSPWPVAVATILGATDHLTKSFMPIAVTVKVEPRNVIGLSNSLSVGSNPTVCRDSCLGLFLFPLPGVDSSVQAG
jgi:hypothetical protein